MRSETELLKIKELIEELCDSNYSIDRVIPKYLYHFTDIDNVSGILNNDYLCSRNHALTYNLMENDNASEEVINITTEDDKNFVRFYFRPKTPTQHHNEGVKSDFKSYDLPAHCPVPIFLLFNSEKILSLSTSKFVERNLATKPKIYDEIEDLLQFDFEKIYHLGATYDRDVIQKRHAEVLIEEKCDLDHLSLLFCRSTAEKVTLINLLSKKGIPVPFEKIRVDNKNLLFNKKRAYINYVDLDKDFIKIGFINFHTLTPDDNIELILENFDDGHVSRNSLMLEQCNDGKLFKFNYEKNVYDLTIKVNDKIVYLGCYYNEDNLPF